MLPRPMTSPVRICLLGGLLPVIAMLEKLGFQALLEETLTSKRIPRAMDLYRFVLAIVLGLYIGFARLNQLRFIARDPILTGILKVTKLPVQCTFWRFVNALHRHIARQMLTIRASAGTHYGVATIHGCGSLARAHRMQWIRWGIPRRL